MNFPTLPPAYMSTYLANTPALTTDFPTLPPAPTIDKHGPWLMIVPVLSTGHLPRATFDALEELDQHGHYGSVGESGALIRIGEPDELEGESTGEPALDALYAYVSSRGYSWIRLDADGDVFADLAQYKWDSET